MSISMQQHDINTLELRFERNVWLILSKATNLELSVYGMGSFHNCIEYEIIMRAQSKFS